MARKTDFERMRLRWHQMHYRCYNPDNHKYSYYGARGIKVCDRWHIFQNFLDDLGLIPRGLSIDRIDNDGDYSPENTRITDNKTQRHNNRARLISEVDLSDALLLVTNGVPLREVARIVGYDASGLRRRLRAAM